MNHNAIPALVGCGLVTAGGCAAGGFGGYVAVAPSAPIYGKALGSLLGASLGGIAGGWGGVNLAEAIQRHGERRAMRRMARMPIGRAEPAPAVQMATSPARRMRPARDIPIVDWQGGRRGARV